MTFSECVRVNLSTSLQRTCGQRQICFAFVCLESFTHLYIISINDPHFTNHNYFGCTCTLYMRSNSSSWDTQLRWFINHCNCVSHNELFETHKGEAYLSLSTCSLEASRQINSCTQKALCFVLSNKNGGTEFFPMPMCSQWVMSECKF